MTKLDPRRALACTLEKSVEASIAKKQLALYLSREEWALVIAALRSVAELEKGKGGPQ